MGPRKSKEGSGGPSAMNRLLVGRDVTGPGTTRRAHSGGSNLRGVLRPSGSVDARSRRPYDIQMEKRIAFFTFGVMRAPLGDPGVQGFVDRLERVYATAEASAGFVARSIRNYETWEHSWGPVVAPQCTPAGVGLNELAMTLSVWRDLEAVAAFAYHGSHGEALSKRSDWFRKGGWPGHVAWWIDEHHQPSWSEAVLRIDQLNARGSEPEAFTFRRPFDPSGVLVRMKGERTASQADRSRG